MGMKHDLTELRTFFTSALASDASEKLGERINFTSDDVLADVPLPEAHAGSLDREFESLLRISIAADRGLQLHGPLSHARLQHLREPMQHDTEYQKQDESETRGQAGGHTGGAHPREHALGAPVP